MTGTEQDNLPAIIALQRQQQQQKQQQQQQQQNISHQSFHIYTNIANNTTNIK